MASVASGSLQGYIRARLERRKVAQERRPAGQHTKQAILGPSTERASERATEKEREIANRARGQLAAGSRKLFPPAQLLQEANAARRAGGQEHFALKPASGWTERTKKEGR